MFRQAGRNHRQLKEVDCSLARPAYLCCIDLPPYSVPSGWPATLRPMSDLALSHVYGRNEKKVIF